MKKKNPSVNPLKLWGKIVGDEIVPATEPAFTAQCLRVPVSDGHMGAVFVDFKNKPSKEEMIDIWTKFSGRAQELNLPSAPKQFLHYFTEDNLPQTKLSAIWRAVWLFPSAACVRIRNMIINSFACPTTRCAAQRAARC